MKNSILKKLGRFFSEHACLAGLIFMIALATLINSSFLTLNNFSNVLRQMATTSIIALGMSVVAICGSIDLSVGSLYCVSAVLSINIAQINAVLGCVAAIAVATLIGLVNGLIIVKLKIHQWITTLSMMLALRGLALIITNQNTYKPEITNAAFEAIARANFLVYLNWPIIIMVGLSVVIAYFLHFTQAGREMYAVGSNAEAARMMGINTGRVMIRAHMISGFMTGVSGVLLASRVGSVSPLVGDGMEMYAIAACVVGGVHLSGGCGKISNVFVGAAIVGLLTNIFNMQRALSTFWEPVITGMLVLIVVLVQRIITIRAYRRKKITEAV